MIVKERRKANATIVGIEEVFCQPENDIRKMPVGARVLLIFHARRTSRQVIERSGWGSRVRKGQNGENGYIDL
jgi:hypothetical protein